MSNSIVTYSGLRCTKVRRTAVPSQSTATTISTTASTTASTTSTTVSTTASTTSTTVSTAASTTLLTTASTTSTTVSTTASTTLSTTVSTTVSTTASTSAGTTATDQATATSSARQTQVSTASHPVPQPSVTSTAATVAAETEGTTQVTVSPSSSGTSALPAVVSSNNHSSHNTGQKALRIAIGTSVGAVVLIILVVLLYTLIRRRRNRAARPILDHYATEKPKLDRPTSTQASSPSGSSSPEGERGSNVHIRDDLAQLEALPRAMVNSPAGWPRGLPFGRSQSINRSRSMARRASADSTDIRNPFSDASQIQSNIDRDNGTTIPKNPFADPSPPVESESRLSQPRHSFSRSDSGLLRNTMRSSTSRYTRIDSSSNYDFHSREDSTGSSVIILPGRSSLSTSEHTLSYQPTPAGLERWRPVSGRTSTRSSRISTRSDPFDLEELSMTMYKIGRPFGVDIRFDQTFSSTSDSTIYSPQNKNEDR